MCHHRECNNQSVCVMYIAVYWVQMIAYHEKINENWQFPYFLFLCSVRDEGLSGFYKGIKPNLIRVIPACGLTFVIYEEVSHYLLERAKQKEQNEKNAGKSQSTQTASSKDWICYKMSYMLIGEPFSGMPLLLRFYEWWCMYRHYS